MHWQRDGCARIRAHIKQKLAGYLLLLTRRSGVTNTHTDDKEEKMGRELRPRSHFPNRSAAFPPGELELSHC